MGDYGIKVSKTGTSVTDGDVRNLLMSSKYNMLKYHSDTNVSVTFNPGDSEKTVDVTHNLGYVPAFLVYYKDSDGNYFLTDGLPTGIGYMSAFYAYADSSKVRCGVNLGYNHNQITKTSWIEAYGGEVFDELYVGNYDGVGLNSAVRYLDVQETSFEFGTLVTLNSGDTIESASLDFYMQAVGSTTTDMKIKTYGIDRDDCTNLSGDQTTASTSQNVAAGTVGERFGINITDQVQEIVNRPGWSTGNAMGFYINDNGSASNIWRADLYATPDTYLVIRKSGTLTFSFRVIIFKNKIA